MATSTLIESVLHWKKKLDKDQEDEYILNVVRKLSRVPMTLEILEATHIGKTIRKLSKRDDVVGKKAKTVLNKWRETFANQGSDKHKPPNISKKENVNQESKSSNSNISNEKVIHKQEHTSRNHENKHKNNSVSLTLSQQPSKSVNGSYSVNSCTESSHSLYKYEVKERNFHYMDYDPHAEGSEGYNPERPELFPTAKPVKTKKTVVFGTYEPSSVKRNLDKVENEEQSPQKRFKSDAYSNSNDSGESKKLSVKDKHNLNKEKAENNSSTSTLKKEHNNMKAHTDSAQKHKPASDAKKIKSKESSETDRTKSSKNTKLKIHSSEEFTSSEASFEACLGFNDIVSLKKSSKSHSSAKKQPPNNTPTKDKPMAKSKKDLQKIMPLDLKVKDSSSNAKKTKVPKDRPLNNKSKDLKVSSHSTKETKFTVPKPMTEMNVADITATLPEITPDYKPLPRHPDFYAPKKIEVLSNEQAIYMKQFTSSRNEKTCVYSGRKSGNYYATKDIPKLFEICIRVLMDNIDAIECVGDASYEILKPVLERCSPSQLYNIENYNPNLIEDTNVLWETHCKRDYKLLKPMEHETWRELYWRAHDEREQKLKYITANISASMSKSTPVRQVKLAYVDAFVKPPRDVARKQAKHGTAGPVNQITKPGLVKNKIVKKVLPSANSSSNPTSSSTPKKPKIAPLMAKTLKSIKAYRRK